MIKYSFIVPVYNCEKYLETCILSILRQNSGNKFEVILVNDGSQDASGELADKLADDYINVRTFHKRNGGASSARNKGLSEAQGKYILFVDGDDTIADNLLEKVDHVVKNEEWDMIIYGMSFDYFRHANFERSDKVSCGHEGEYNADNVWEEYKSFFDDNALSSACNKVFLADVIRKNNLEFNETMMLYEDYDFVLRYLICIKKVCCIAEPLYHYRNDLENMHLNSRVYDLKKMRQNLQGLLMTSIEANNEKNVRALTMLNVTGNLYMQLLVHNMLSKKYSIIDLRLCLTEYCSEPLFRKILADGVELESENLRLLDDIDEGRFRKINHWIRKKRFISGIKKTVKRLINTVRVRR